MSDNELLEIGDRIVGMARAGEQVEVVVGRSRSTEVRVYEGDVESLSSAESAGVGVRVVSGHRQGFAYAGSLDPDVLADTLADARDNAGFATEDEFLGLAEPDGVAVPDLDLYREGLASLPTERKIDLAAELERAVRAADPRITGVESADYADGLAEGCVVTSTGIRASSRESSCYVSASCVAQEGDDTQTGFGFSVGRLLEDLDIGAAAADAARRATRLLGATKPSSGRVTVVLDPFVTAQLIAIIGSTFSGEAVLKGRSLFADRLGEEVAAAGVTLVDDPTNPLAYTAGETDGEGLASRRNVLIEGGVLQRFVHNAYSARRAGTTSTANAVRGFKSTPGVGCRALSLAPGRLSQPELLAQVGEGVLVSSVSGLHSGVNPVSGDFSTGAEGLRISGGALGEPLREFTIASTLQRMLLDVEAVGADIEWLPMSAAGVSLVIRDVTVSGA
ncbi:MAG: peptidase family protein [Acidimicrobiales bacterium]|nr:peptidase family protein [Acidimicrobiales bacterium]